MVLAAVIARRHQAGWQDCPDANGVKLHAVDCQHVRGAAEYAAMVAGMGFAG